MEFSASAPCKCILFGEHYVVYGAPALSLAIEPRNTVKFSEALQGGQMEFLSSVYGKGRVDANGAYSGAPELAIYAEVAKKVFGPAIPPFSAEFFSAWKMKGTGTSASLCAAFAAGAFKLSGKQASAEEIFAAAQTGDLLAHGGKASGIDAKTVSYGKPWVFQRSFDPPAFHASPSGFALPTGTAFLLADTNTGIKDGTAKMISLFASSFGIATPPQELPEEERNGVWEEYTEVWAMAEKSMRNASGRQLGQLMNDCHDLLKMRGVSSAGMERAVATALSAGAHGAKMTGAGGEGGAVIVLCEEAKTGRIAAAIEEECGFSSHEVSLARKGACID